MEDLIGLYNRTAAPVLGMDFSKNKSTNFSIVSYSSEEDTAEIAFVQTQTREAVAETVRRCQTDRSLRTCLVIVPMIRTRNPYRLDIREENYNHILESFGLLDYAKYAMSRAMTVDVIPRFEDGKTNGFFASVFSEHFFGIFLRYDKTTNRCLSLAFCNDDVFPIFNEALSSLKSVSPQPGFVLLVTAATFNSFHDNRLTSAGHHVSRVEKRTRYQGWDNVAHRKAEGSLSEISAQTSGLATSLSANRRAMKMSDQILHLLDGTIPLKEGGVPRYADHSSVVRDRFDTFICMIKRRVAIQHIHLELLLAQVQNQLTALFNLTNRNETELSIQVAKDSRMIALASKRDSTSMKTLAAVTVAFLPGTFVASLFSMSMFDWQPDEGSIISGKFWVYWVISVPLTLLTIGIWYIWINRRAVLIRSQNSEAVKDLSDIVF